MSDFNKAFLRLSRRAESADRAKLVETFVDVGALFTLLSSRDHQAIYGRRGTGKTHALLYLADSVARDGDIPVYVDLRMIGSTGGLYADDSLPLPERGTRLLMDTLAAIHEGLLTYAIDANDVNLNLASIGPALDSLAAAITEVSLSGPIENEENYGAGDRTRADHEVTLGAGPTGLSGSARIGGSVESSRDESVRVRRVGELRHRVHFGSVGNAMQQLIDRIGTKRIWLLLDEWSVVPLPLQPYLADLLRRSLFPLQRVTVKIGAIEQRSQFHIAGLGGSYVGIELGADMAADLNLDDFMVFDNNARRATEFFEQLLFKHYLAVADELALSTRPTSAALLIQGAFTQRPTFEEFVRASEGVPRDAINILSLAAQRAGDAPITREHIRGAARDWFQRDKDAAASANAQARSLLHWIIDEVIAHRRARAFLLDARMRNPLVDALFDARVLHVLKKNISSPDEAGVRYDAYKIDYGCYVDLLATARAPEGLLPADDTARRDIRYVEVPPDDYRAIRRAILDLNAFQGEAGPVVGVPGVTVRTTRSD